MSNDNTAFSIDMNASQPATGKFTLTEVGIEFHEDLSFEEWSDLGERIARVGRSLGFMIGDWINYGAKQKEWGDKYTEALKATGMDYTTLQKFSRVAGRLQLRWRHRNLSFEHHVKVAAIKEGEEQNKWLQIAAKAQEKGKPLSTRRLAKSILLGRVATDRDMVVDPADKGIDNVHPHVNGLLAWWRKMEKAKWLSHASPEQRQDLKRDLQPVVDIYNQL